MNRDVATRAQAVVAALLAITAICVEGHRWFPTAATTAAILLLLVVLVTGATARLPEALVVSVIAALGLDLFFIPPIGSITVADSQGWVALSIFLVTAFVASHIAHRFQQQRERLIARNVEAEQLHALSRWMLLGATPEEMKRSAVSKCIELFGFSKMALFDLASNRVYQSHVEGAIGEERLRRTARSGTDDYSADGLITLPISLGNVRFGSLGMVGSHLPPTTLSAIANTLAVGLAQAQAQIASGQAEAVRRSEELKSVMIDALAHDFKSPLTSIEASAEMLQSGNLTAEQQADLLSVIREESQGLHRLIEEALHLARIDADRLHLQVRPLPVNLLIKQALDSLGERTHGHLQLDTPYLPLNILVDLDLMAQALKQLVDNALKYGNPNAPIVITSHQVNSHYLAISVRDAGPGLTEFEQAHVFDKFYRGRHDRSAIQGTGMGLSIAKEIVEAHGGELRIRSQVGEGTEFTIILPAQADSLESSPNPLQEIVRT